MELIGMDLMETLGLRRAVGTTTGPCDRLHLEASAVVMTTMALEVVALIDITAADEAGRDHHTIDTDDTEAVALKT